MTFSRFRRLSIVARIALAGCLSLVVFAVAMLIVFNDEIKRSIYTETDARVQIAQNTMWELIRAKGTPSLRNGRLRLGRWLANNDNSLVDHVQALTGADATLFAILDGKPMRVTTTIRRLGTSSRIVNTELVGPARAVLDGGRSFAGVSPIDGRPFINRYDVLRDARGTVVGIVYTGIPLTTMDHVAQRTMRAVLVGTLIALLASLTLLYLAMRPLKHAFRNAVTMARGLASGDLEQDSNIISDDGLGEVNFAFREMISYQQRMAGIADALARGDFSAEVKPASERDRLGVAFAHMTRNVHDLVQQLERAAMTDTLTHLGNRRAFDLCMRAQLARAARRGTTVWLALIDVDNFKAVNDDNGHQHGDVVLTRLGSVLQQLRAEDYAFRLGGDEFAVVLTDSSLDDAKTALERVRSQAQMELFGTTVSVGLAGTDQRTIDVDTLQRQADAALYVCKQRGRNIVVTFDDARAIGDLPQKMNVGAVTRLIAEEGVRAVFQPIWDSHRGSILGFEALARPSEKYGLAGPQEAFDVAAKIGRSHDLDRVCRGAALANIADLSPDTLLFLNVSPETLARGELKPEALAAELACAGLSVERVVLELTEKYAGPADSVLAAALELQRFGFRIALDDTGAGNAGLEYLSRFQFDFIKVDARIVTQAREDAAARSVITAIVALATTTNASVIAEGIEDQATLDVVRSLFRDGGMDANTINGVQGYFLGRPGSIGAGLERVEAHQIQLT